MKQLKLYFSTSYKKISGIYFLLFLFCLSLLFSFLFYSLIAFAQSDSQKSDFYQSTFSAERLENSVKNYVAKNCQYECEISIEQKLRDLKFPQANVKAAINHDDALVGFCNINLQFFQNNKLINEQKVRLNVKLFDKIPVASRFLAKGEIISEDDISIKKTEITNFVTNQSSVIIEKAQIIGKKAKSGIAKNSAIQSSDLISENDIFVKKGEKVKIIYYAGAICIRTEGFALENGSTGSVIKVKSNDKTLHGFIAEDGNIIIEDKQNLSVN
jgi:flagella basal body P-ring formation protein FlgA